MNEELYIEYIRKDLEGTLTELERKSLAEWRSQSVDNQQLADRLYQAWEVSAEYGQDLKVDLEADFQKIITKIDATSSKPRIYPFRSAIAIAAGLIILCSVYFLLSRQTDFYIISDQENMLVTLPDQSKVVLSKGSSISYAPSFDKRRQIKLKGNGYFEVNSDSNHPFTVTSSSLQTVVTGTTFYINDRDTEEPSVMLVEGQLSVKSSQADQSIALSPGEMTIFKDGSFVKRATLDPSKYEWYQHRLYFDDAALQKVVTSIESYFNKKVELNASLSDCLFTGSFQDQNMDDMLQSIAILYDAQLVINGKRLSIEGGSCK